MHPAEPVTPETPYRAGATVCYFREVESEAPIPFAETVIYEDERLLIADKPHFVPVTPSGAIVNECLLFRLQRKTGLSELAPIHRLDRDTAGLVAFSKHAAERGRYTQLFQAGQVERKYLAVAKLAHPLSAGEWEVEGRVEPEPGSFRMRIVPGPANARTRIRLMEVRGGFGRFELFPATGKKHQLRLHMTSLGLPIVNDAFYPAHVDRDAGDFSQPLQLLAAELSISDPFSGQSLSFHTRLHLSF